MIPPEILQRKSLFDLLHKIDFDLAESTRAKLITNTTVADAICDRLVHNAHRITLKGESMRKTKNRLT
jgi:DNA replication protein DnaC